MELYYEIGSSLIGEICVLTTSEKIIDIFLFKKEWEKYLEKHKEIQRGGLLTKEVIKQIQEYFNGDRRDFDLPLEIVGSEYRVEVWKELSKIPYGEVVSYQDIANRIGNPKSVRAIGQANRANRFPIVIPCHRVIGQSGKLIGYAGDNIDIQDKLLQFERKSIEENK